MKKYKLTSYNVLKDLDDGRSIIYNTLSEAVYKIDSKYVKNLKQTPIELEDEASISEFLKSYVICEVDADEKDIFYFSNKGVVSQTKDIGITIVPSRTCNLRCVYCVQNNLFDIEEVVEMDEETMDGIIAWLKKYITKWKSETLHLIFYGGEPLTTKKESLKYLLDQMDAKLPIRVKVEMVTNGTLIKQHAEIMPRIDEYRVTIDGLPELHDTRRMDIGNRGSYHTIIENLKEVITHNPDKLVVRINVDKDNRDQLIETVDRIMEELGVEKLQFVLHPVQPFGEDITTESLHNELSKTGQAMADCSKYLRGKGVVVDMWKMNCGVSSMSLWVFDTDGKIYKCLEHIARPQDAVSNIYQDHMEAKFYQMMNRQYDNECLNCQYLGICLGGCYRQMEIDGEKQCYKELFNVYVPSVLEDTYA